MRVFEADETEPFGLFSVLVSHDLSLEEGGVVSECSCQCVFVDVIPKVSTEDPVIVCRKLKDTIEPFLQWGVGWGGDTPLVGGRGEDTPLVGVEWGHSSSGGGVGILL